MSVKMPKPIINGKVNDIVKKSDYTGWGCIDVFDAISYIKLMKKIYKMMEIARKLPKYTLAIGETLLFIVIFFTIL
jgi:hypothetical protein